MQSLLYNSNAIELSQANPRLLTPPIATSPVESPQMPRIHPGLPKNLELENNKKSRYDMAVRDLPIAPVPQLPTVTNKLGITQNGRKFIRAYGIVNEGAEIGPMIISRRTLLPTDVEIDLHFCGICHSDIHHAYNEWKDSIYPQVPGHEMVGLVSNIGIAVTEFRIGDKVAIGNLVNSCRQCKSCNEGHEQYCLNGGPSWVYNGHERNLGDIYPTGELTLGGYSEMIVVNKDFVLKLPNNLDLARATPLLCAGITVFTPLIQRQVRQGVVVGVAGVGGLGHLAIKMAKAMGATVIAITRTPWKLKDATALGADYAILASDDSQMRKAHGTIDLILDTIPHPHEIDLYINLLNIGGKHWILGNLETIQPFNAKKITNTNKAICASNVGGIPSTRAMLQFCSENNILADIELTPIENLRNCFDRIRSSDVKYRFVIDLKKQRI